MHFGIMGIVYAERVRGVNNPRIGLISNGEEAGKGSELVKGAYPLLENARLNFVGNVEGKEIFNGHVDVAVTDGFTGNVLLKSTEAVAKLIVEKIRETIRGGNLATKVGGMLDRKSTRLNSSHSQISYAVFCLKKKKKKKKTTVR